ncbi:MAG TPA: serine kinase [Bacteroidota bacterium]|nr:serine kinase [Bacteroidota bacterium]
MTLQNVVEKLHLSASCGTESMDREVRGGYTGDLLSDVIAHSSAGDLWVTMQVHVNIVAVAVLKDLAGIIIVQGRQPAEDTVRKATEEHVAILVSALSAYETTGKLHALLSHGP